VAGGGRLGPAGRGLLVVYQVHLGCPTALETGRMLSFFLAFSSHWVCPIASWRQRCVFVYVTFVEFEVISRLSCSPGVFNRAGNTGNAREMFLDFLAFFVDITFGKFWVDYFPGVSGPESRPTFVAHRFDAGGVGTGPTLLRAGHSNPC